MTRRTAKPSTDCTLKAGMMPPRNGSTQQLNQLTLLSSPKAATDSSRTPPIALAPPATTIQRRRSRK